MADWSLLRSALERAEDRTLRYTWDELEELVGELPASAKNHRAWWSGERPHVHAWRSAGYCVTDLVIGCEVTFSRTGPGASTPVSGELSVRPHLASGVGEEETPSLLLVTCVKEKVLKPAAAKDLYVSALFKKEREYAERSGLTWFILSAEHGVVAPDEWLSPYERFLPDTSKSYRQAWGVWVAERLALLWGSLQGHAIEIHAGSTYVEAVRGPLESKGARLVEPLAGLSMGLRLAWYDEVARPSPVVLLPSRKEKSHRSTEWFCDQLTIPSAALAPADLRARGPEGLKAPGLYSWWVDQVGANDLSVGLGLPLRPGLIYAGLAGATRWPSGRASTNTLWSRIAGMHLGGRHEFSTFRRTLGSVLATAREESTIDEDLLTEWMNEHLKVVAVPFPDGDTLGRLEKDVLQRLDPPLNLQGMAKTTTRRRLTDLRRAYAPRKGDAGR